MSKAKDVEFVKDDKEFVAAITKTDVDLIMETLGKVVTALTEVKAKMDDVIVENRKWYKAGKF